MSITLFLLSLLGGLLAGLLGVGGAVVMIPLMLAVPPWVGVGLLEMKQVAGLSMLQVLASSVSGALIHRGQGNVHGRALVWIGLPMAASALAGAWASRYVGNHAVLAVFAFLMLVSLGLLLSFRRDARPEGASQEDLVVSRWKACVIGMGVGLASGMAGAGGGFILVPMMVVVLRIPLRVTIGTSLGIVFLGSLAGAVGKVASGQVEWHLLWPVLLGSIPAARFGARLSHSLPSRVLRRLLILMVGLSFAKACWMLVREA